MSLSDAERDALEQLQDAIENGDLSLLRKLLNQTDLRQGALFGRSLDSFALFQGATRAPQTSLARSANIRDVPARGLM